MSARRVLYGTPDESRTIGYTMRYTSRNVSKMFQTLIRYAPENRLRFLYTALQIGGDIGHGSRYIGMGGRQSVEYGGLGARRATAYLYGIGVELGIWDTVRVIAESGNPDAQEHLNHAMVMTHYDISEDVMSEWSEVGRDYARRSADWFND